MNKKYKLKRLLAYIIDWFLSSLIYNFIGLLYYSIVTQMQSSKIDFYNLSISEGIILLIICLLTYIIYYICIPYFNEGKTIGKKLFSLKIMRYDHRCLLRTFIIRFIILIILEGFIFYPATLILQFIECFINETIASILYKVSIIITLVSLLAGIISNKMFHDYISVSEVVNN